MEKVSELSLLQVLVSLWPLALVMVLLMGWVSVLAMAQLSAKESWMESDLVELTLLEKE
jgi:hypothetical protein